MNDEIIGNEEIVLIEGFSRRSEEYLSGRTDTNKVAIIPAMEGIKPGDYVKVKTERATSATLFCKYIEHTTLENSSINRSA